MNWCAFPLPVEDVCSMENRPYVPNAFAFMKSRYQLAALAILLFGFTPNTPAQTIFDEDFDGGLCGLVRDVLLFRRQPDRLHEFCSGQRRETERLLAGDHDGNNLE